ncbi:hypothetical protein [Dyella sp. 2HG41-7]|uniref:hypothetical protein n=1 Tax=Dyella sp. 2HG41-7 TaxID=2883239 RepID=UPI001F16C791|nr:hypothetical protein [Dyella sp. 2HG41-7]
MSAFSKHGRIILFSSLIAAVSGAALAAGQSSLQVNPYSPANGHAYRHGVIPTMETWRVMQSYESSLHRLKASSKTLYYGGGATDGSFANAAVTSGPQKVYLVFYGSQWGTSGSSGGRTTFSNDPSNAAPYLQNLFLGLGTGEGWSNVMTQYCDGAAVARGASSCPASANFIPYPAGSTVLAGVWYDNSAPSPQSATQAQLAQEALNAAAHFGNNTAASNRYVQYVILSPTGTNPDGFNAGANFCAWHDYTTSSSGDVAYTNMPYVSDAGASCGQNFVNAGVGGVDDGFSIVEGHEYAETLTDQFPSVGWVTKRGSETGDVCAWISTGQGASGNVSMKTGTFAMQSTYSDKNGACELSL